MSARLIRFRPSLSFVLLGLLLGLVALGGGSSREDALGQAVVRAGAAALLAAWALGGGRAAPAVRPVVLLIGLAAALIGLQLVPLPPALWMELPGRTALQAAATLSGQSQPWRALAIVPDAAWNALFSLIVPLAAVLLAGSCRPEELRAAPFALLVLILGSALVGLAQFSGAGLANPLMNARPEGPSGLLANRNHQALLLAIGCLAAPAWAFGPERAPRWRGVAALGCVGLLLLMILATGSRAGLLLGALALLIAAALVGRDIRRMLKRAPRWVAPAMLATGAAALAGLAALSLAAGRAESLQRLAALDPGQDMRTRALPVLLKMTGEYFPAGSGFGSFDAVFRRGEPFHLLKPTYFNHAHNDVLEIVLTGGAPALLALLAGIAWWLVASVRAWRNADALLPRLGSTMIFLILVASVFDYPARTPLFMVMLVLAAVFLTGVGEGGPARARRALRRMDGPL